MYIGIPIAGLTLSEGQTYNGYLPVWATRPFTIRIVPDSVGGTTYPTHIRVIDGGLTKKELELPYQMVTYIDLSFVAPLLTRADRNNSDGTPNFPQQVVEIWSRDESMLITIPVFHCDETYKYTLGIDEAFPQPVKPRIPGQNTDIYFPYPIHPSDALSVQVEPVTGAPSSAIFPTTYVLGDSIDITYVKKLTIKNVWGPGLDQVINYEDRLADDAEADKGLQCALRARWNMRNGQWFWAAFKDYFWSNKFTAIRGRGGVTEQAEITINLEYGEEWYNVYQEMLVSSNVVFTLNIPGINQYQSKRFRAEVSGDTGARWSNSTRTYRQQVRFKTTELQDNYVFLNGPDNPPTPAIAFSAQRNPWTVGAAYGEGLTNSVYSNAAWEVQSTPSWISVDSLTGTAGTAPLAITVSANTGEARSGNIVLKSLAGSTTYTIPITQEGSAGSISVDKPTFNVEYVTLPVTVNVTSFGSWYVSQCDEWIEPSVSGGPSGTTAVKLTIVDNMKTDPRTGTITFSNDITENTAVVTVNQGGVPSSIGVYPFRMSKDKSGTGAVVPGVVSSDDNWTMGSAPSWVDVSPTSGGDGQTDIEVKYDTPNNTGAKRSGYLRLENMTTHEIAICIIEQLG